MMFHISERRFDEKSISISIETHRVHEIAFILHASSIGIHAKNCLETKVSQFVVAGGQFWFAQKTDLEWVFRNANSFTLIYAKQKSNFIPDPTNFVITTRSTRSLLNYKTFYSVGLCTLAK